MVTLPMTLSNPNTPLTPIFLFESSILSLKRLKLKSANCMHVSDVKCHIWDDKIPKIGVFNIFTHF